MSIAVLQNSTRPRLARVQVRVVNALAQGTTAAAAALGDELKELASSALATLRALLDNPDTPPAVRLRTALAILECTSGAWTLPEPAGRNEPKRARISPNDAKLENLIERVAAEDPPRRNEPKSPGPGTDRMVRELFHDLVRHIRNPQAAADGP